MKSFSANRVLAILLAASVTHAAEQKVFQFLPVGDSITEGGKTFSNYRYPLWEKLHAAGYLVEFVGSRTSESRVGPLPHEGHGGKNAEFLAEAVENYFRTNSADVVLIHAGHNHTNTEAPVAGIVAATEKMIQTARAANPKVIVLVAQVIPSGKLPKYEYIPALNVELGNFAARLSTPQAPVVAVNMADGFDWRTDTIEDHVHPNARGAEKMAAKWFAALTNVLAAPTPGGGPNEFPILTPKPPREPRINGPTVFGARPGNPFLYRIPCTGERPVEFSAKHLPDGLKLDSVTGIINGTTPAHCEYVVTLKAENSAGHAERKFKIVAGDKLALTPPMGWNPWYVHSNRVDDRAIRAAADAMVASGMADAGYQFVSIDDCWMNASETRKYMPDPTRVGPLRDNDGNILPNPHFPDMKALTDFIHAKGLKAGIYSSPGAATCCGLEGSWQHEEQDAARFSAWGFDLLKYDWCSYGKVAGKKPSLEEMQRPYRVMGAALRRQPRDIIFNLCQYGMGNVWEWGADVGGHSWRTAGDLGFELDRFFNVALKNAEHRQWSKPGAWNDPDYLQIGWMGAQRGTNFTLPAPCPLSADEQYSYMSLWCLMAAPLFFSGDMEKLDAFTLNVLCNPEVIAVDQDALGQSARLVKLADGAFALVKDLENGAKAVGLFNPGATTATVAATWSELGIKGRYRIRDLWRQQDLGKSRQELRTVLPRHGVWLVRLGR